MKIIDKAEQEKLFSMYETPEHVQLHCNEVARVAGLIGEALNEKVIILTSKGYGEPQWFMTL